MKKLKKTEVGVTNCNYRPQYLPNGGIQWLLPKPWTSSIKQCMQHRTGALLRPSKWSSKYVHFLLLCHLLLHWRPLGQYGASSHLMAASRCFQISLGHATSGSAICIAPVHRCGHKNGQQQRCIRSSIMPLLYHNT
jgi:hypothetical protein